MFVISKILFFTFSKARKRNKKQFALILVPAVKVSNGTFGLMHTMYLIYLHMETLLMQLILNVNVINTLEHAHGTLMRTLFKEKLKMTICADWHVKQIRQIGHQVRPQRLMCPQRRPVMVHQQPRHQFILQNRLQLW